MTDDKYHHDPGHFRKTRVSPPWLSNTCFNARSLFRNTAGSVPSDGDASYEAVFSYERGSHFNMTDIARMTMR